MKQKTKEQSKDEDEKLKPRESIMKIIMKYSPIKRDDLIEETSKLEEEEENLEDFITNN